MNNKDIKKISEKWSIEIMIIKRLIKNKKKKLLMKVDKSENMKNE